MKILIAEDDAITLSALSAALREAGHLVVEAHDGDEALRLAAAEMPDAVVIDEKMPGRSGLTVAREVRRERVIPVLLVTAYNDESTRAAAVAAGIHAFLVKPVGGEEVIAALEVAAAAARRERDLAEDAEAARRRLEERKVVERAKGVLMRRQGLSEEEAYCRIQQRARSSNLRMLEVARAVLEADDMI